MPRPDMKNVPTMLDSPAEDYVLVVPSDTVDIPEGVCRALLVGSAGAAGLVNKAGVVREAVPLQAGYNPIRVKRVNLAGLGASDIWALY